MSDTERKLWRFVAPGRDRSDRLLAGRYEIADMLGEGGTAVVYRARDRQLGRPVAVKLLKTSVPGEIRERFAREAQAVARLAHPNVVTVYDSGEENGRAYVVMELVDGGSLLPRPGGKADLKAAVRLLEQAARGLQHAHERGIVHRDLKPHNVLVTRSLEAKVADFGLARQLEADQAFTRTGMVMGTPGYMAPEQVAGRSRQISPRTDVYGLGAILYEILTGRVPHVGQTTIEVYQRIMTEEIVSPRRRDAGVPRDLDVVAMKALEKSPARRYASAAEFADDLKRWLSGEPILARPPGRWTIAWRVAWRRRTVLAPAVAGALLGIAGAWWSVRATTQGREDRELLERAAGWEADGRLQESRDAFHAVVSRSPSNEAARRGVERIDAELRRRAEGHAEALRLLERARPMLDRADRHLRSPDARGEEVVRLAAEARAPLERAVELDPPLVAAHHLLGGAWQLGGDSKSAEACWRRALALDPAFGPAHYRLGRLLAERVLDASGLEEEVSREEWQARTEGALDEADREIGAAMREGSGFDDALQREIAAVMRAYIRREVEDGRARVRRALQEFEGSPGVEELFWLLGAMSTTTPERLEAFEAALRRHPNHARTLSDRGRVYAKHGHLDEAIRDFDAVLRIDPRNAWAYFLRSRVRIEKGDLAGAAADMTEVIALVPGSARAFHARAGLRERSGDLEGAIEDIEQALLLAPQSGEAEARREMRERVRRAIEERGRR